MGLTDKSWISGACVGLGVAAGLIFLGCSVKGAVDAYIGQARVVTVKGLAERRVPADQVIWPITFRRTGDDLLATHALLEADSEKVIRFLKDSGLGEEEISFGAPNVQDRQTEYSNGARGPRYVLTGVITVNTSKVALVRSLISRQKELVGQGISVASEAWNTRYIYTKLNDVKPGMVEQATKNAREVAQKFASDSGSHIGRIKAATQGQFSVTDADSSMPYEKNVRVVTTVTYFLKD
ncbi:SIMPL domain-containing protein [Mesosutterella sp. OilRF-GAM-744-9]|uniref:SIMPL domain-containing protein n=1 Tax=Mesosutterella porci TaxID=2915351 RepID=A0ABS9MPB4_9BURK|nr:SIMPL domain-containing protein [Mesosutterella sp. oilRF-744-WT-GAM-9]MCG5030459.1 SIMPL domain-containing protein [Mesosutterella sp. oilRF-744-WT-GAM-9]MCI6530566.1 SIMPL domain-containing protein [Mesosutterella sp.]